MSDYTKGSAGLEDAVSYALNERVHVQAKGCNMLRNFILTEKISTPSIYHNASSSVSEGSKRTKPFTVVRMNGFDNMTNKQYILGKNYYYGKSILYNTPKSITDSYIPEFLTYKRTNANRYHNKGTDELVMGSVYEHTHVLARIMPGEFDLAEVADDAQGAIIPSLIVPLVGSGFSAVYYRIDNTHNMRVSKADCFVVACAYAEVHRIDPFLPVSIRDLLTDQKPLTSKVSQYSKLDIKNLIDQSEIPTFAAHHHININGSDIYDAISPADVELLNTIPLRKLSKLGQPALTGIILWYLSLNDLGRYIVACNHLFDFSDAKDFIARGKELSERAKFLHNICGIELIQLFEVHTLINRIETPINWEQERENRINPNLAEVSPEFVFEAMVEVFTNKIAAHGSKYKTMDWQEFWSTRFEWSSTGADFSQYEADAKYKDSKMMYRNKMMLLNAMPSGYKLSHFIQRTPQCVAKTSIKYEWSKQRAIYGCDLTNFIMFQFALGPCEEYLDNRFASGIQSNAKIVNAHLRSILQNSRALCLDFEDFNSQHSNANMCAVLRAFYYVFNKYMSDEQRLAFGWCMESMKDQIVIDNIGLKESYSAKGTLFSGWRLTSFMNSALNYCYFKAVNDDIRYDAHAHAGDDIIAGVTRHASYREVIKNCMLNNIRLSQGKCHYASVSEFLRVDHESKETGQYLARSIATLVFSRIESTPAYDIKDICESYLTRSAACLSRGGKSSIINAVSCSALKRINKTITGSRVPLDIVLKQSRVCGGLSDLKVCEYLYDIEKLSLWKLRELGLIKESDMPDNHLYGIDDYSAVLAAKFRDYNINSASIRKKLHETLVATFAWIPARFEFTKLESSQIAKKKTLQAIRGAHTTTIRTIDYGRARTVGVLLDVLENSLQARGLAAVVRGQPDKLQVLSLII